MQVQGVGGPGFSSPGGVPPDKTLQDMLNQLHSHPVWDQLIHKFESLGAQGKCTPEELEKLFGANGPGQQGSGEDIESLLNLTLIAINKSQDKTSPEYKALAAFFKERTDSNGHTLEYALNHEPIYISLATWFSSMENQIKTSSGQDNFKEFNNAVETYLLKH